MLGSGARNDANMHGYGYYSPRSVKKLAKGEYVVLMLTDIDENPITIHGATVRSLISDVYLKCETRRASPASMVLKSGRMGSGKVLERKTLVNLVFKKPVPGSPLEVLFSRVCK